MVHKEHVLRRPSGRSQTAEFLRYHICFSEKLLSTTSALPAQTVSWPALGAGDCHQLSPQAHAPPRVEGQQALRWGSKPCLDAVLNPLTNWVANTQSS